MSKQTEMENIYQSFEWLLRERLEQLDALSRKMCNEMSACGISQALYLPYIQIKVKNLAAAVVEKEDEDYLRIHNQTRRAKRSGRN
ncbi:hypothetical protein [Paenibacillus radicis (ex Xue et al. 2023)]|uniref:Uncharacterized protein n=1 Tax=Paenibacillus radicis (ex Xue et al. 2023) TaxID=2972489 RepID=A0ABT1YJT9_9BACL|nr:hypothetical protein [Paenibacillus radicis (ex Xue et al. 2023)]MCR8633461.1 hypothetical protein [Paenibacillus radicis (ex Xue et al. 2023)]